MFRQTNHLIRTATALCLSALLLGKVGHATDLETEPGQAKKPPAKLDITEVPNRSQTNKDSKDAPAKAAPAQLVVKTPVSATPAAPVALPIVRPRAEALGVRIRDMARIESLRSNQLVGYGIVTGLNGTGDTQQSPFTIQAVVAMLQRFGVTVDPKVLRTKNVAAVMITAEIGAFAKKGSKLDVTVSSVGDASSLQGGVLLQTPLLGADENVYAVVQGGLSIGGFAAGGGGNSATKNHPTSGRVPLGADVEREIPTNLTETDGSIRINLAMPDFENAIKVTEAINEKFGAGVATAVDSATIRSLRGAAHEWSQSLLPSRLRFRISH